MATLVTQLGSSSRRVALEDDMFVGILVDCAY